MLRIAVRYANQALFFTPPSEMATLGAAKENDFVATFPPSPPYQDLHLYWLLEIRLLNGEAPQRLLADIAAARSGLSSYQPLFDGLEGELLARLGQREAGRARLETALRQARFQAGEEPNYRVHQPVLEERLAALGRPPRP